MATGHIRKRTTKKGTTYQLIIEGDRDPFTGSRTRQYKSFDGTKKQAEQLLRKLIVELDAGIAPVSSSAMKFKDWLDIWLGNYVPNISETTRAGYKERINKRVIPDLGNIPLKNLTTDIIQAWIKKLQVEYELSAKSVKNVFHNVDAALKQAVNNKLIPYNPCVGVVRPKLEKYNGEVYSKTEIEDTLNKTQNTDMFLPVLLGFCVGLRRGEMLALRWEDINFEEKTIFIHRNRVLAGKKVVEKAPKSDAGIRTIPVGDKVLDCLKRAHYQYKTEKLALGKKFSDEGYVIRKKDGTPYRPDSMTQKWERFVKKNDLKPIRLHDLRHSCATEMIVAGVDPKTAQERLGHADVSVTMNIYAHATKSANIAAAKTIDEALLSNF